jgi:hypothetical protein
MFVVANERKKGMKAPHSEAEKRNCSFCGEFADDDLSITHRHCGARTHADCLPAGKPVNYKLCSICTGETVALNEVASLDVTPPAGAGAGGGREPFPPDGVDYVLQPGSKRKHQDGAWQMVAGLFSRSRAAAAVVEDVKTSQDGEFLLKNRVSVRDMLRFNKLGLQHLLKVGVDMTDFLSNGYTWNDLLLYEDVGRKGATRAKQALIALRCTANHFRDYPDALPYKRVAEHAQLQPYDLGTHFGLEFPAAPAPGPLQCAGDENWTARDCVRMGLKMDDLMDFGLVGLQQYEDLMVGLSKPDAVAAERDLQVTPKHIESLIDLLAPAAVAAAAPKKQLVRQQPVRLVQEEVVEPTPPPTQGNFEMTAAEPAVPIRQPRPVRVAVPVTTTRAMSSAVVTTTAVPLGAKNKFDRHGALVKHVIIK